MRARRQPFVVVHRQEVQPVHRLEVPQWLYLRALLVRHRWLYGRYERHESKHLHSIQG
jgi:hypothetical protein